MSHSSGKPSFLSPGPTPGWQQMGNISAIASTEAPYNPLNMPTVIYRIPDSTFSETFSTDFGLDSVSSGINIPFEAHKDLRSDVEPRFEKLLEGYAMSSRDSQLRLPHGQDLLHLQEITGASAEAIMVWYSSYYFSKTSQQHPILPAFSPPHLISNIPEFNGQPAGISVGLGSRLSPSLRALIKSTIKTKQQEGCSRKNSHQKRTGDYTCSLNCNKSFPDITDWRRHEEESNPQDFWFCFRCSDPKDPSSKVLFHRKDKLLKHLEKFHPEWPRNQASAQCKVAYRPNFRKRCNFCLSYKAVKWRERFLHEGKHIRKKDVKMQNSLTEASDSEDEDHCSGSGGSDLDDDWDGPGSKDDHNGPPDRNQSPFDNDPDRNGIYNGSPKMDHLPFDNGSRPSGFSSFLNAPVVHDVTCSSTTPISLPSASHIIHENDQEATLDHLIAKLAIGEEAAVPSTTERHGDETFWERSKRTRHFEYEIRGIGGAFDQTVDHPRDTLEIESDVESEYSEYDSHDQLMLNSFDRLFLSIQLPLP